MVENYANTIGGYISNLRDLKQFLSAFKFHYEVFKKQGVNINIIDLLFITALKTFNFSLWQLIYNTGKDYLAHNIEQYISFMSSDYKNGEMELLKNKLLTGNYSSQELNIVSTLIPSMQLSDNIHIYSIDDRKKYDLKRIWSNINTFNLYFEFKPPKSKITMILSLLSKEQFEYDEFTKMLETNLDWSDLSDIVYSSEYKKYHTINLLLNYIDFISHIPLSSNFKVTNKVYETYDIYSSLSIEISSYKIKELLLDKNINFNNLIEICFILFLFKKGESISKLRDLNSTDEVLIKNIVYELFKLLKNRSIMDISSQSLYYLCLSFGQINKNIPTVIQQKIYDDISKYDKYELLDYLKHFINYDSSVMYRLNILKERDIFTQKSIDLLNKKLKILKNNQTIMNNTDYVYIDENIYSFDSKPIHFVNFVLDIIST